MPYHHQTVVNILRQAPDIELIDPIVGASEPNVSISSGYINVRLKFHSQRKFSADEIIQELTLKLHRVPGIQAFLQSPLAIPIGA